MKSKLLVSLFAMIIVGSLCGASFASTPGVYIDDQFGGTALNSSYWTNVSTGGGSATVASNQLTLQANGYGNPGAVMSVAAVHPGAGQTVTLTTNVTYIGGNEWDFDKIFGFTSDTTDPWASGAGIYFVQGEPGSTQGQGIWALNMNDGVHGTQTYYLNTDGNWRSMSGPTIFTWTATSFTWQRYDPWTNGGQYYTVFDSSTMAPLQGGSWNIPTVDMHVIANTFCNQYQFGLNSAQLQVTAVPEPSSLLALSGLFAPLGFALLRKKK